MGDLDLQRAWVSQMTFSGLCARMKQNETDNLLKECPIQQGKSQMLPVHDISG